MKKIFLYLIVVFSSKFSLAQIKNWDKTLGGQYEDILVNMVNTIDGGILCLGNTRQQITNNYGTYWTPPQPIIKKLNSSGLLIWELVIPQTSLGNTGVKLKVLNDGNLLVLITENLLRESPFENIQGDRDIRLIKISSAGQIINDQSFGGDYYDDAIDLEIDTSNNIYILGSSNSGLTKNKTVAKLNSGQYDFDYWLIKLNSSGVKIWDKAYSYKVNYGYDFFWSNRPKGLTRTSDNNLILYGNSDHPNGGFQNCSIIKVDINGTEIWNKQYAYAIPSGGDPSTSAKKLIEVSNSYFFLGSVSQYLFSTNQTYNGYRIYKIDNNGNVVWETEKPGTANDFLEFNGNLYCSTGYIKSQTTDQYSGVKTNIFDYSVSAFDLNGIKHSEMVLKAQNSQIPNSIIINSGKVVIGGSSSSGITVDKSEASKGGSDWWIVKLNTESCSSTAILKGLIVTTENNKSFDASWSNNLLNVGSYQWRYKNTSETNWSTTTNSPQFFGVQNIPSGQTYHYQVKAVCLNGQQTAWSTSPSIYLRNQVPVIDYPPTVTTNQLSPGGNIQVKGSKFTPNGNVTLEVRGISGFGQDYNFTSDANGEFTHLVNVTTTMKSGKYTIKGIDYGSSSGARISALASVTGTPANKTLEFSVNSIVNTPTVKIVGGFYEANSYCQFLFEDFIGVDPPYNTYLNAQGLRRVQYKVELGREISPGNYTWIQTAPLIDKYVKAGEKQRMGDKIYPNSTLSAGKYVVRVTDQIKPTNISISPTFELIPVTSSIIVEKQWDYTYPDIRNRQITSISADGVSRFYLKTLIGNTSVTKVKVELMDENNSTSPSTSILGKLKAASNISFWSDEANDANQKSIFINSKIGDSFWCWYVAPDNFADGNLTTTSINYFLKQRNVKVKITGYSSSNLELVSKVEEINIVRPPLYLMHGLGGQGGWEGTWDGFKFDDIIGNKKLFVRNQDGYFPAVISPQMEGDKEHDFNANILLAEINSNIGNGRSFQWNIENLRKTGLVVSRFDYVAHSMGGCMLRAAIDDKAPINRFYTNRNYGKGYVNKFITLTTPHNGSPLGDIVTDVAKDEYFQGEVVRGLINRLGKDLETFFELRKNGENYVIHGPSKAVKDFAMANKTGGRKFGLVTKTKSHLIVSDYINPDNSTESIKAISNLNSSIEELDYKATDTKNALNMLGGLVKGAATQKALKDKNMPVLNKIFEINSSNSSASLALEQLNTSQETADFMNYYSGYLVPEMENYQYESDLIVPLTSQLAGLPLESQNVTQNKDDNYPNYLEFKANHNFLPDKICDNDVVGNRVFQLLNSDINSPLFGDLNASPYYSSGTAATIAKDNETQKMNNVFAANAPLIESRRVFSKARIDEPLGSEIIPFGTEKPISTYISDTTKLVFAKVIVGNEIIALPKTNANTLNYLFDNISLGNQKIYLEAVYSYGLDSLITYWDSVTINVNSNLTPQSLVLNQQDLYIFKGDTLSLNLGLKYSTFSGNINSSSVDVGLLSSNTSKVIIAPGTKNLIALDTGYVMLTYTYKGLSINQFVTVLNKQLLCKDNPSQIKHNSSVSSGEYSALETIESSVNVPDDIYYYAGKAIFLKPGFSVGINETFLAEIRKCEGLETISTEGLVAYYPFDGNANDASGNGNNGIVSGPILTSDRFGLSNKAYNFGGFSGSSIIRIPNSTTTQFANTFTISLWYYQNTYAGMNGYGANVSNGYHMLFAKEADWGGFYAGVSSNISTDSVYYNHTNKPNYSTINFNVNAKSKGLANNLNTWIYMAYIVENGVAKIFKNGVKIGEKILTQNVNLSTANTKDLFFGRYSTTWYPLNGKLDDIRIYNRALSDAEVQALYNAEKP